MEKEIWRAVVGYEGLYDVSNLGNVRSVDHYGWSKGHVSKKLFNGRLLTPQKARNTYRVVFNDHKRYIISRLVAKAFPEICGEWFDGCQVHHKDLDPANNRAENLIVLTADEHLAIHYSMGKNQKDQNPNFGKKISEAQIEAIRSANSQPVYQLDYSTKEIIKWFPSAAEAGRQLAICKTTIERVANHKTHYYSAGGYKWDWA